MNLNFTKIIKIFIIFNSLFINSVNASNLQWNQSSKYFDYYANNDSLRDVLTNFATNYGISVFVSDKVSENITGDFSYKNPTKFLTYISELYNLIWYYDGAVLYVYKSIETQTALIQFNELSENELKDTLISSGIWDKRFSWKPLTGQQSVYLAGPPRYVELITQVVKVLEQSIVNKNNKKDDFHIEIIPLKYASAIDRNVSYRGNTIVVPGIASVLQNILIGINVKLNNDNTSKELNNEISREEQQLSNGIRSSAMVKAEPALNAIIIRDSKNRIPLYQNLISKLDVPQTQIEVGLSIIDINVNNLQQIGIDWQGGIDIGTNRFLDFNLPGSSNNPTLGNGIDFSSVLDKTNLNYLIAKINLLQTAGGAQVVSRPMLLTQENVQAVLSTSETFYIKLVGVESQSLEEVTSGMVFKIVPRIVGDRNSEQPEINLSLQIEDGSRIPDSDIDGLPTTRKTEMSTLATVKQGQSLLIGGVYRDEVTQRLRKVPLLGDIPYLGNLFTSEVNTKRRTVRLFIVEPRIVSESLGNNLVIDSKAVSEQFLTVDEISNKSLEFRQAASIYICQQTEEVIKKQQDLVDGGYASTRQSCYLPDGSPGMRIILGICNPRDPGCYTSIDSDR